MPTVPADATPSLPVVATFAPLGGESLRMRLDPRHYSQRSILACLQCGELYEAETSLLLKRVLRPGDGVLDIGAHVGWFTLFSALLVGSRGTVMAFEPHPGNFSHLQENILLNGFAHVHPFNLALADRPGEAEMFENLDNDGGHALWDVGDHDFNRRSRATPTRFSVELSTLDKVMGANGFMPLRLVKMDVEGAESAIVRGGLETLVRCGYPLLVMEINRFALGRMGSSEEELRANLAGLGYRPWIILPDGRLRALEEGAYLDPGHVFNLAFACPDRMEGEWIG